MDDHYSSEEAGQAIGDLGAAIGADPKKAELYVLRAIWDRYAGRDDEARRDLEKVLALDADFAPARYLRGPHGAGEGRFRQSKTGAPAISARWPRAMASRRTCCFIAASRKAAPLRSMPPSPISTRC
jgi:hypothetical protein